MRVETEDSEDEELSELEQDSLSESED